MNVKTTGTNFKAKNKIKIQINNLEILTKFENSTTKYSYNLYAVINHIGNSVKSGHYTGNY